MCVIFHLIFLYFSWSPWSHRNINADHFRQCSERQRIYRERGIPDDLTQTFDENALDNTGETDDEEVPVFSGSLTISLLQTKPFGSNSLTSNYCILWTTRSMFWETSLIAGLFGSGKVWPFVLSRNRRVSCHHLLELLWLCLFIQIFRWLENESSPLHVNLFNKNEQIKTACRFLCLLHHQAALAFSPTILIPCLS